MHMLFYLSSVPLSHPHGHELPGMDYSHQAGRNPIRSHCRGSQEDDPGGQEMFDELKQKGLKTFALDCCFWIPNTVRNRLVEIISLRIT